MRHVGVQRLSGWCCLFLLAVLPLSACASTKAGGTVLKIGTDLPVTGVSAGGAKPAENGVVLAVKLNQDLGHGYTLDVVTKDDSALDGLGPSGDIGQQNIKSLIADNAVIAGVGPFNSGIAKVEMALINGAGLTFISPTNTNPGLTKAQFAQANGITNFAEMHPSGKPDAYFRLPGTDDVQGKVLAEIAALRHIYGGPEAKRAFIVDDNSTYGIGLANYFNDAFTAQGGTVAGRVAITDALRKTSLMGLAAQILAAHPDIVFYGGISGVGGDVLKKDIALMGSPALPFIGGDGIADDPSWPKLATSAGAVNTIGTIPAPDVSALTSSAALDMEDAYKQMFPGQALNPFAVLGYDCAMVEINAIKHLIANGQDVTRAAVRNMVAQLSYVGITGAIAFDANGDNTGPKVFSVYDILDTTGVWHYVRQFNG